MSLQYVCDNRGCSATAFVLKETSHTRPLGWVECEVMDFCSWRCVEAYARQAAAGASQPERVEPEGDHGYVGKTERQVIPGGPYHAGVYRPREEEVRR